MFGVSRFEAAYLWVASWSHPMFSLVFAAVLPAALAASPLTVDYLDVGQGDGVLIRTPDGHTILVDGGKPSGDADLQLAALGVTRIDLLIATHADYDHAGVHEDILAAFPVTTYVTNGLAGTSQSYARITAMAAALEASGQTDVRTVSEYAATDDLGWGDVQVHLLAPPAAITNTDQNTHSIGVVVERGDFKTLVSGDSERRETDAWLAEGRYDARIADVDIYKGIHHGSRDGDAGNDPWLDVLRPEVVVVQVGRNSYGHPTAEALATYARYTGDILRTDLDGRLEAVVYASGGYAIRDGADALVFASGDAVDPEAGACPVEFPVLAWTDGATRRYATSGTATPDACYATAADAEAAGYLPS